MGQGLVIVTGGSGEIGTAIAMRAARAKYSVCLNYLSEEKRAADVVAAIRQEGGRAMAVRADVRSEDEVAAMFDVAAQELGRVTALVNNAGVIGGMSRVDEVAASVVRHVLDVNVVGAFVCASAAIRQMSTRHGGAGGAIVNISSRASKLGNGGEWVHYAASKGALDTLTVGLSREVAAEGIRVNAVNPGLIDTQIHAKAGQPDRLARLRSAVPMGRAGTVEEVAAAVEFLLSPAASYITGVCVDVSGGR